MKPYVKAIAWRYYYPYRVRILLAILYIILAYMVGKTYVYEGMDFTIRAFYLLLLMPLMAMIVFPLTLFTDMYGHDLLKEESSVSKRLLTSPLSTREIVFWPMLMGCVSMMVYWFVAAECFKVLWLQSVDIPIYWPMFFVASVMAWMQVLAWRPFGSLIARLLFAGVVLSILFAIPQIGVNLEFSESQMILISGALIGIAYLTAIDSVNRARTGEIPQWNLIRSLREVFEQEYQSRHPEFRTTRKAMGWYEWRVNGLNLPIAIGILFPPLLLIALLNYSFHGSWEPEVFLILLWLPILFSAVMGIPSAGFGFSRGSKRVQSFTLIKPVSSWEIVKTKYRITLKGILYCYGFVYLTLLLTIKSPVWTEISNKILAHYSGVEIPVLILLVMLAPMAICWTLTAIGLAVGLTGRSRLITAVVCTFFVFMLLFLTMDAWIQYFPLLRKIIRDFGTVILVLIVSMKILITGRVLWINDRKNLMNRNEIRNLVLIFSSVFAVLWGLSHWLIKVKDWQTIYSALLIVLLLPMISVAVAPLSLYWNRHR